MSRSRPSTKEAQESAAVALYNQALTLLRQSDDHGAEATFRKLLDAPFVRDVSPIKFGKCNNKNNHINILVAFSDSGIDTEKKNIYQNDFMI